jgi:CxxC-x17-CxxC domain-containing protein
MLNTNSTEIKFSDCGKVATVPFTPTAGKPVYCKECLSKHRKPRSETGYRVEAKTKTSDQAWSRRREGWLK